MINTEVDSVVREASETRGVCSCSRAVLDEAAGWVGAAEEGEGLEEVGVVEAVFDGVG